MTMMDVDASRWVLWADISFRKFFIRVTIRSSIVYKIHRGVSASVADVDGWIGIFGFFFEISIQLECRRILDSDGFFCLIQYFTFGSRYYIKETTKHHFIYVLHIQQHVNKLIGSYFLFHMKTIIIILECFSILIKHPLTNKHTFLTKQKKINLIIIIWYVIPYLSMYIYVDFIIKSNSICENRKTKVDTMVFILILIFINATWNHMESWWDSGGTGDGLATDPYGSHRKCIFIVYHLNVLLYFFESCQKKSWQFSKMCNTHTSDTRRN